MSIYKRLQCLGASLLLIVAIVSASASAEVFGFSPLEGAGTVTDQLSVEVTDQGLTTPDADGKQYQLVDFTFKNDVGTASSITDIYFYDGEFLGASWISSAGDGVDFTKSPTTPGDLPGLGGLGPATFVYSTGIQGNPSLGVDEASDYLTIEFSLLEGKTFDRVVASLYSGAFFIGLHVQSIGPDEVSESYITRVPVPGAALLGLLGLGAAGVRLRRYA